MELEVPPDAGNGPENAGLPLARLLWHLPAVPLVALIEALLLERRILMVAQERDTVSAAVHAAGALLYPLRWQHIFLPLLPLALKVSKCCAVREQAGDMQTLSGSRVFLLVSFAIWLEPCSTKNSSRLE